MLQKKGERIDIRIFANVLNYCWLLSTLGFILFSSMLKNFHNQIKIKIFKFPQKKKKKKRLLRLRGEEESKLEHIFILGMHPWTESRWMLNIWNERNNFSPEIKINIYCEEAQTSLIGAKFKCWDSVGKCFSERMEPD